MVDFDEGSERSLLLVTGDAEEEEEAIDDGLTRRRKMKKTRARKRSKLGFTLVGNSEMDGDDDGDGDVLGAAAMQFGRRNHPPRAHKGSISIDQHQG